MLALGRHLRELGGSIRRVDVNGQPGVLFLDSGDNLMYLMTVDIADGVVQTVRSIINPDKLRHVAPLSDFRVSLHT
jgi:RNA polymerase sigma-70 factor (ECF subfamily)